MNTVNIICSMDDDWTAPGSTVGVTTVSTCKTLNATLPAAKHAHTTINSAVFDRNVLRTTGIGLADWQAVYLRVSQPIRRAVLTQVAFDLKLNRNQLFPLH